jgi:hypothetical protein
MRTPLWTLAILAGALLAAPGCGKNQSTPSVTAQDGTKVDMPRLQQAFVSASPELRDAVTQVAFSFRYGQNDQAVAQLEKIAASPELTADQKKAVNDVMDQLKQVIAKGPAK